MSFDHPMWDGINYTKDKITFITEGDAGFPDLPKFGGKYDHSVILVGKDDNLYKTCSYCKKWALLTDFHKCKGRNLGLVTSCKSCACKKARESRVTRFKDPLARLERNLQMTARLQENKLKAVRYKGGICYDCKVSYPPYVYDFHHLDPSIKEDNLSALLRKSFENTLEELDKCIMICANCHRERHFGKT